MSVLYLKIDVNEPDTREGMGAYRRFAGSVVISEAPIGAPSNVVTFDTSISTLQTDSEIESALRDVAAQAATNYFSSYGLPAFTGADVRGGKI